jgi:glycosyltransferase involved in cell wall biosynthesis
VKVLLDGRIAIPRMTGAGRYVIELARRLPPLAKDLELEVHLLPAMQATDVPVMLRDAGADVQFSDTRVATLKHWIVMRRIVRRSNPHVYHYPFVDLPWTSAPSVVTIYDMNPVLHPAYFGRLTPILGRVADWMVRSALHRSRAALAISDTTRDLVQQRYPESAHKVRTTRLGVDLETWARAIRMGDAAPTRSVDAAWRERPYFLYVGVDRPHKNLVPLMSAFARFRALTGCAEGRGPYIWLAGVGQGSAELGARVTALSLRADVRQSGELGEDELRGVYAGALALVYVSTSEGFGLPLLEAFAAGVPVMAGNTSSLPEVGGDAVMYASPHDEAAMAEALVRVYRDPALRNDLVKRGRERAAAFSWDETARATLAAYYDVVRDSGLEGPGA